MQEYRLWKTETVAITRMEKYLSEQRPSTLWCKITKKQEFMRVEELKSSLLTQKLSILTNFFAPRNVFG